MRSRYVLPRSTQLLPLPASTIATSVTPRPGEAACAKCFVTWESLLPVLSKHKPPRRHADLRTCLAETRTHFRSFRVVFHCVAPLCLLRHTLYSHCDHDVAVVCGGELAAVKTCLVSMQKDCCWFANCAQAFAYVNMYLCSGRLTLLAGGSSRTWQVC